MKTKQITITRNIPVLDTDGKRVKDDKTGYNVTKEISFKGTQVNFNNDLVLIPDYGKDKRCPVQTACKLSGVYTKLIQNNLKALKMNYCGAADQYTGAYFGTKNTVIEEVMNYLQSIKADKNYLSKIARIDEQRKAEKNGKKQGESIARVGARGDAIQAEQNLFTLKSDKIMNLNISDDKKAELIASL